MEPDTNHPSLRELVSMTSRNAKEALAISPAYVKSLESDVQSLKAILDARPASLDRVPFLPFGTDASQAFVSHFKCLNFKNGRGLIFLTQFNIEPSLVNNQGLMYVFQGSHRRWTLLCVSSISRYTSVLTAGLSI